MKFIDSDLARQMDRPTLGVRKSGVSFDQIYFADDTVLLATKHVRCKQSTLVRTTLFCCNFDLV